MIFAIDLEYLPYSTNLFDVFFYLGFSCVWDVGCDECLGLD